MKWGFTKQEIIKVNITIIIITVKDTNGNISPRVPRVGLFSVFFGIPGFWVFRIFQSGILAQNPSGSPGGFRAKIITTEIPEIFSGRTDFGPKLLQPMDVSAKLISLAKKPVTVCFSARGTSRCIHPPRAEKKKILA